MMEMTRTTAAAYSVTASVLTERQDLEKVYRGMRELEYCPTKIREFSESFCKAGLVAVHLSSCDRWEKLRKRLSPELASDEQVKVHCSYSCLLQAEALPTVHDSQASAPKVLEDISFPDLKVGACYPGRAACGTLCVEPFPSVKIFTTHKGTATVINSLLEDKLGRVIRVIINLGPADNFLKSAQMAQAIIKYRRGSTIGVETPNLRRCGWDKSLVMYVDHPAKVHFVKNPHIARTKATANILTRQGDAKLSEATALFKSEDWFKAVEAYTECIDGCVQLTEGSHILERSTEFEDQLQVEEILWLALMGRCATWLQMKNYKRALSDANRALELEPQIVNRSVEGFKAKIHFMKGSALFSLERFQEAADAFNVALRYNPEDKSVQLALDRSKLCHDLECVLPTLEDIDISSYDSTVVPDFQSAYQQSQLGHFDLSEYFLSDETAPPPIYASYVGPVEIRRRVGRGRGLFLKDSVVAGQLLLVSEALALLSRNPKRITTYKSVLPIIGEGLESSSRREMSLDIQEELITQLTYKMLSSKRQVLQVYSLGDGRSDDSRVIPDMEIFLPTGTAKAEEVKEGLSDDDIDDNVDIKVLREILAENAVCDKDSDGTVRSWGVWALPSFINHSCYPNSHKIKVADFLIVYASQDMSAGTEISLPYFNVFQFVDGRRADSMPLGFVCRCNRCLFEQSLPCCFGNLQKKVTELLQMTMYEEDDLSLETAPSLLELARLAEALEQEMLYHPYSEKEKNWIRASMVDPYLACSRLSNYELQELHPSNPGISRVDRMSLLVDAFTGVDAGHKFGRTFAAHLLHEVGHDYGWGSQEHLRQEIKVMKIYRTYYGITDTDVLRQLIAKVRLEH